MGAAVDVEVGRGLLVGVGVIATNVALAAKVALYIAYWVWFADIVVRKVSIVAVSLEGETILGSVDLECIRVEVSSVDGGGKVLDGDALAIAGRVTSGFVAGTEQAIASQQPIKMAIALLAFISQYILIILIRVD